MSVAGNRAGLSGARSGLFMEQVRLVKEMRNAERLRNRTALYIRPRFMVWENVPGAFSSGTPKGEDSGSSSRRSSELKSVVFQSLDLTPGAGNLLGLPFWENDAAWLGECWTLNTGESPSVAVESFLWQILEDSPPQRYYLSQKACRGILERVKARGKKFPEQLLWALKKQAGIEG